MLKENKQINREIETYTYENKLEQRHIRQKIKKQKQKSQTRVYGLEYAYAYIRPAYVAQLYTYAYFKYAYACKKHTYAYTSKTLTHKQQEQKQSGNLK